MLSERFTMGQSFLKDARCLLSMSAYAIVLPPLYLPLVISAHRPKGEVSSKNRTTTTGANDGLGLDLGGCRSIRK